MRRETRAHVHTGRRRTNTDRLQNSRLRTSRAALHHSRPAVSLRDATHPLGFPPSAGTRRVPGMRKSQTRAQEALDLRPQPHDEVIVRHHRRQHSTPPMHAALIFLSSSHQVTRGHTLHSSTSWGPMREPNELAALIGLYVDVRQSCGAHVMWNEPQAAVVPH